MLSVMAVLLLCCIGLIIALSISYLLLLLFAAARRKPVASAVSVKSVEGTFVVLIPAHNEELVLAGTLTSLSKQNYPNKSYEVVVIADNCTDATAEIAALHGATVLERTHTSERGKGYALDWAFQQLIARSKPADAFVIVDADTWVAPDFLTSVANHLTAQDAWSTIYAIQGRYGVDNFGDGWRTALMSAAFDLFNHVKPCGREALKLSVGLKGNGMVFTLPLMRKARWSGASVTEDIDFGITLARDYNVRVAYEPLAIVRAQMPATTQQANSQRRRWEIGRYELVKQKAIPLFREGLSSKNILLLDTACDLMIIPMGELVALSVLWTVGTLAAFHFLWHANVLIGYTLVGALWTGLLIYILYGLKVAGARREAFVALLFAPAYVIWKLLLYAPAIASKFSRNKEKQEEWVRTERMPIKNSADHAILDSSAVEGEPTK